MAMKRKKEEGEGDDDEEKEENGGDDDDEKEKEEEDDGLRLTCQQGCDTCILAAQQKLETGSAAAAPSPNA